jgi:uncharacterized membrane protein YeaQ/YmgE (transglycosylase-associated protein family)
MALSLTVTVPRNRLHEASPLTLPSSGNFRVACTLSTTPLPARSSRRQAVPHNPGRPTSPVGPTFAHDDRFSAMAETRTAPQPEKQLLYRIVLRRRLPAGAILNTACVFATQVRCLKHEPILNTNTKRWCVMDIASLVIQLLSGAAGGNIAGAVLKKASLGPVGNSIVGILGGGLGGQLLGMLGAGDAGAAAATSGLDIGSIVASIAGGGVGGGVLLAVVGLIREQMKK